MIDLRTAGSSHYACDDVNAQRGIRHRHDGDYYLFDFEIYFPSIQYCTFKYNRIGFDQTRQPKKNAYAFPHDYFRRDFPRNAPVHIFVFNFNIEC